MRDRGEEKKKKQRGGEGGGGRPTDDGAKVETNCWNKTDLELVFVAAGSENRDHMWKQSAAKRFLITSSEGWALFPRLAPTR